MAEDLVLDTAIRDWVLIPLSVVMVLIGVLRYFVSKLMRSSQPPDAKLVKEGSASVSLSIDSIVAHRFFPVNLQSVGAEAQLGPSDFGRDSSWVLDLVGR